MQVPQALMQSGQQLVQAAAQGLSGLSTSTSEAGGIASATTGFGTHPDTAGVSTVPTDSGATTPAGATDTTPVSPSTSSAPPLTTSLPLGGVSSGTVPAAGPAAMPMGMPLGMMAPAPAAGQHIGADKKIVVPVVPHTESVTGKTRPGAARYKSGLGAVTGFDDLDDAAKVRYSQSELAATFAELSALLDRLAALRTNAADPDGDVRLTLGQTVGCSAYSSTSRCRDGSLIWRWRRRSTTCSRRRTGPPKSPAGIPTDALVRVLRMTTRPFVPPPREPAPEAGGGKISVDAPIAAPVPPPRSIWGIVLPIGLVVGVVGFIVAMYVSGQRSLANGFVIFPLIMLMSMGGMLFRSRGAAQKMPWSQLEQYRREYFARLDEVRDEVADAAEKQWNHRAHSHWPPSQLVSVAGSQRMWERRPGDPEFGVVRLGTGQRVAGDDDRQAPDPGGVEDRAGHRPRAAQVPARAALRA